MAKSFDELVKRTTTKKTRAKAAHRARELLGELLLSAMLTPAVSPNIFATFAFLSALSVVCHCCLNEKWVTLFLSMLYCDSRVVSWETRLA